MSAVSDISVKMKLLNLYSDDDDDAEDIDGLFYQWTFIMRAITYSLITAHLLLRSMGPEVRGRCVYKALIKQYQKR